MWKESGKTAEELYGTGLMEIGDYINYDAGTWTDEERNSIATGYKTKNIATTGTPTKQGQFGGLSGSKNGTNGWRIAYIGKSTIGLVSADCVESYKTYSDDEHNAFILEVERGDSSGLYNRRKFNQYINTYATSSRLFSYSQFETVTEKAIDVGYSDLLNGILMDKLNGTKYKNLIALNMPYYLCTSTHVYEDGTVSDYFVDTWMTNNGIKYADSSSIPNIYGIRIYVSLSKDVRYNQIGTKANGGYSYKVWDLSW